MALNRVTRTSFDDQEPPCDYREVSKDYWGNTILGDCANTSETPRVRFDWHACCYALAVIAAITWLAASILEICS
jgi:hypothetical protein